MSSVRLTEWTSCGGCAAKWSGRHLRDIVERLPGSDVPGLLVGLSPFDDAAVLAVSDDLALVSTTDFFPPLVDEPEDFGAIAAANACSDVFAMGGRVVLALNIAAFPEEFPRDAIDEIMEAAAHTVAAAGGVIGGGHTIRNPEPIFGLAVQGVVDPRRVLRKSGARSGDVAVLSKPIGTGLVTAAGSAHELRAAIAGMRTLNRDAADQLLALPEGVHAVTDVTGFGLAGHAWEMAERSRLTLTIDTGCVPTYPGARTLAAAGHRTGGDQRNRAYLDGHLVIDASDDDAAICFDPQTSGGLLAAVTPGAAERLVDVGWWAVGTFEDREPVEVRLR